MVWEFRISNPPSIEYLLEKYRQFYFLNTILLTSKIEVEITPKIDKVKSYRMRIPISDTIMPLRWSIS